MCPNWSGKPQNHDKEDEIEEKDEIHHGHHIPGKSKDQNKGQRKKCKTG